MHAHTHIHIEPAAAEDTAAFIRLRGQTRQNAISEASLQSLGITADSWAAAMRKADLLGFVARSEARIVAYCFGDSRTGEVVVLAVLPDFEGQGLGRQLLQRVQQQLVQIGHAQAFLGCSADPQDRSYGFYRHLGWRSSGRFDDRGDEILQLPLR